MLLWKVKTPLLTGSSYSELLKKARRYYQSIEKRNKRKDAFVRSKSLKKKKVFFLNFWDHLYQKNRSEQKRRLPYLPCACELIEKSTHVPEAFVMKDRRNEKYYRWYGKTGENQYFIVQIKEHTPSGKLFLMSVFPIKKSPAG